MGEIHNSFGNRDTHFKIGSSFGIYTTTNKFDQWGRNVSPFVKHPKLLRIASQRKQWSIYCILHPACGGYGPSGKNVLRPQ